MPQEDIAVQILQTVPAEGVFAALAQHLCTALVPLDVDPTHRTLLDGRVRVAAGAGPAFMRGGGRQHGLALRAGVAILPGPSAPGAEDSVTGRARHGGWLALGAQLHTAHRLAFKHRAPGFAGVQLHSSLKLQTLVQLHLISWGQAGYLRVQ